MNDIEALISFFVCGHGDASDVIARLDRMYPHPVVSWGDWRPTRQRSVGKGYKKRHGRDRAKFFETGKHGMKRPRRAK